MEHPNATRMRQTVGAFMAGDIPLLLEGFAENVVWYSPGDTPASGRLRGREDVLRFFTMMDEASGGTLRIRSGSRPRRRPLRDDLPHRHGAPS
jgi:ketosteroid isomerase-like protein